MAEIVVLLPWWGFMLLSAFFEIQRNIQKQNHIFSRCLLGNTVFQTAWGSFCFLPCHKTMSGGYCIFFPPASSSWITSNEYFSSADSADRLSGLTKQSFCLQQVYFGAEITDTSSFHVNAKLTSQCIVSAMDRVTRWVCVKVAQKCCQTHLLTKLTHNFDHGKK
jgi:hypothetical protein